MATKTKKKKYIKMQCSECKKINYYTTKTKALQNEKLSLKKLCPSCKKHTPHKETKK